MKKAFLALACAVMPTILFANTSYTINYPIQVNTLLNQINPQDMWDNLTTFTEFPDRSANHESGVAAQLWLQGNIAQMIKDSGRQDVSVFTVATTGTDFSDLSPFNAKQSSIVVKIGTSSNPGIVVGAHFDTNGCEYIDKSGWHDDEGCFKDPNGPQPGADDDGSGTVTVLETAKVLLNSHMQFNKPIYFIFYAAEEQGLWGSTAVVDYFKKNNIAVDAVLQLDETGFAYHNEQTMYLEQNMNPQDKVVDDDLSAYLATLINTYVKKPVKQGCDGTSDELMWTRGGFKAAAPFEADFCNFSHAYHYAHSKKDTVDKISLTHMTDYLKLAVAFTLELAQPIR